jgi:predicted nucleotidyltransferase
MKHNIIFKAIVGSQSYGTATPESDVDYKGIYLQSNDDILSMKYKEQIEVSKDECYYEIRRFIELLSVANPTILELLFSPQDCILIDSPQYQLLREHRHKFLTKACRHSFGGYAIAQIQKAKGLNKKMNWEKEKIERKDPLDFCYIIHTTGLTYPFKKWVENNHINFDNLVASHVNHAVGCYFLYCIENNKKGLIGDNSNSIRVSEVPKDLMPTATFFYNEQAYSTHCRDYKDYQTWLNERNTQRYVDVGNHGQQIDGKNLLHCRRLLDVAMEIAETGELNVRRPNTDYLLSIRQGKIPLENIIKQAEEDILRLDELYEKSNLPEKIDVEFLNELLLQIRRM